MTRLGHADSRQLGLSLPGLPGTVTATVLKLKSDLSYEEWEQSCRLVGRVGRGVQWWIADLVVYGEAKFGEKAYQGIEAMGYDPKTLTNIAWVAERIGASRRRSDLSFSHHQQVAALDSAAEQDKWLERAAKKGWTRAELRRAMKEAGAIVGRSGPQEALAGDQGEAWGRIRKALDLVKGAKDELEAVGEAWPKPRALALINGLEGILDVAPAEAPTKPPKKPWRRKRPTSA